MYDAFEMNINTHDDALVCFYCCCLATGTILSIEYKDAPRWYWQNQ